MENGSPRELGVFVAGRNLGVTKEVYSIIGLGSG